MKEMDLEVVEAYLCKGLSHRQIQESIMRIEAPERGGGYEAMKVLHKYGIFRQHKKLMNNQLFDRIEFSKAIHIETYLKNNEAKK